MELTFGAEETKRYLVNINMILQLQRNEHEQCKLQKKFNDAKEYNTNKYENRYR